MNNSKINPTTLELLNTAEIEKFIAASNKNLINQLVIFESLPSTNDYLMQIAAEKLNEVWVCLAETQTAGKGRFGRKWVSPFAKNIYLSLVWPFTDKQLFSGLSLAVSIAIIEALNRFGIRTELGIKWPNDVLWQAHKKIAGTLIEIYHGTPPYSSVVIGIGININMGSDEKSPSDYPWGDIASIIRTNPSRNKIAGLVLDALISTLIIFQQHGLRPFLPKWQALDITYNKRVKIITPAKIIQGIACGIDIEGQLLLKDEQDQIQRFSSGEVSLRLDSSIKL